jgi:outer membrane cobalamin receptor
MTTRILLAAVVLSLVTACGTSPRAGSAGAGGDRNVILSEEISQVDNATALDVVQRLRPHFLQRRGPTSIRAQESSYPVVYIDGLRRGDINELRQIPAGTIERIEYVSAADATTRWGTGHVAGVISVTTRR